MNSLIWVLTIFALYTLFNFESSLDINLPYILNSNLKNTTNVITNKLKSYIGNIRSSVELAKVIDAKNNLTGNEVKVEIKPKTIGGLSLERDIINNCVPINTSNIRDKQQFHPFSEQIVGNFSII
jgi:hypothetical protein